jgi:GDP-L-fucose synthase
VEINFLTSKILLTGGFGFLGSQLHRKLLEKGAPAKNIYIPKAEECDLRLLENCIAAVSSKDVVIHAAAVTGGGEFHAKNPGKIFYDNLIMGVQLMEAARLEGVKKFISIGSAAEYPADAPSPLKEEYLWQGFPGKLHAPYAFAKLMLLVQGQAYRAQYGFNAVHLIMANMYGPGDSLTNRYVIPSLIEKISRAAKENLPFIEVWGTGEAKRDKG